MKLNHLIPILLALVMLNSCQKERYLNGTKDKNIHVEFQRFDQDFNALKNDDIDAGKHHLAQKDGPFFEIYNQGVMRLGAQNAPDYNDKVRHFLNDSIYQMVYDTIQYYFKDMSAEEDILSDAFQNYHLLFPKRQIPAFYTHVSGFNAPIVVGDSILSVALDNYLGEDHIFYKNLGTYTYMLPKKNRENLCVDAMRGWLMSEFPYEDVQTTLLNNMVQEGKILFILNVLMPNEAPYRLLGLTEQQFSWLENNELQLWTFAIEHQHLYSKHQLTIAKYMQEGPFFNFLGSGSSPLVGKFLGWQIIKAYMNNNHKLSINDLLKIHDGQKILTASGYKPK